MKTLKKSTKNNIISYGIVVVAFVVMQILIAGGNVTSSLQGQLVPICAYVVMAISLNLTVGVLGELSLGHAGFMSIGAFAGVVTTISLQSAIPDGTLRLIVAIVIGGIFAGIMGFLIGIPVLRLRGDYLAIVTLAFGEIIKNIINCLYVGVDSNGLHISFLTNASALNLEEGGRVIINGPMGVSGITKLSTFLGGFILIIVTLFIVLNLINSRQGRAVMAIRDNRIAAESVGINVTRYKMMAFITSAALAGCAGALYAMNYSTIVSTKFDFNTSILVLVFVVLGGLGNIWGSIIAATLLTILPEMLRQFNDYRMLIYAIVLILVMLATNNPTVKNFFARIVSAFRRKPKPDSGGGKEGTANE